MDDKNKNLKEWIKRNSLSFSQYMLLPAKIKSDLKSFNWVQLTLPQIKLLKDEAGLSCYVQPLNSWHRIQHTNIPFSSNFYAFVPCENKTRKMAFANSGPLNDDPDKAFILEPYVQPREIEPAYQTSPQTPSATETPPNSLENCEERLKTARGNISKNGYIPKYTDGQLNDLAQNGDVGKERFQVRFMEQGHLAHRDTPNEPLSGKLGVVMKGKTGEGAKYWSTSFNQIEDADTDPKLISEKLGLTYDPTKKYVLIVVDTEKATPLTGVKSVPATFDKVSEFANTELPSDFPQRFTDKAMTSSFQKEYAKQYAAAIESGALPNAWSNDTAAFQRYLDSTDLSTEEKEKLITRMKMHKQVGNNQDYLGNGLTQDNIATSPNKHGAVETLNFERNVVTLNQLASANAIKIIRI